jgi:hypothetical protein
MVEAFLASKLQQWHGLEISSNPYEQCKISSMYVMNVI